MSWETNQIGILDSYKQKTPSFLNGNDSPILDLKFSPLKPNILASSNSNNKILFWNLEKNLFKNIINKSPFNSYKKHNNQVNFINFNPIVSDLISSSTKNGQIHIWSIEERNTFIEYLTDSPTTVSWNQNGNLIGATTKNKNINIFDPRNKEISLKKFK